MALNDNLPIGTIIIWAGDQQDLPEHWRVCNGKSLKKSDYPTLYSVLGENWVKDEGFNKDFFNIPDLRGVFLRGVNDQRTDSFKDPDINSRTRLKGDSTLSTDLPGSFQQGAVENHAHALTAGGGSSGPRHAISIDASINTAHDLSKPPYTASYGSTETRPVNASVYFAIKVKQNADT
jgi:microcystin-dependent protein